MDTNLRNFIAILWASFAGLLDELRYGTKLAVAQPLLRIWIRPSTLMRILIRPFYLGADPVPTFNFDADPDYVPHQSESYLQQLAFTLRGSIVSLHFSIESLHATILILYGSILSLHGSILSLQPESWIWTLMRIRVLLLASVRIRIRLFTLLRIRILLPKMMRIQIRIRNIERRDQGLKFNVVVSG